MLTFPINMQRIQRHPLFRNFQRRHVLFERKETNSAKLQGVEEFGLCLGHEASPTPAPFLNLYKTPSNKTQK